MTEKVRRAGSPRTLRLWPQATIFLAALLVAGLLAYGRWIETARLEVTHLFLRTAKLPPNAPGLTIVQLSDLHLHSLNSFHRRVATVANSFEPDLVVITGDIIGSSRLLSERRPGALDSALTAATTFIALLKAKHGVFAVRGNNEMVVQREVNNIVLDRLRASGARLLCNQHQRLELGGTSLYVLGADFFSFHPSLYADFRLVRDQSPSVVEAGPSLDNAYSHYVDAGSANWRNYECTGAMSYSGKGDVGMGVTIYSGFGTGDDRFYRLRWREGLPGFRLDAHGSPIRPVQSLFFPQPERWYRFRIRAESGASCTRIRAKVWEQGSREPATWQLSMADTGIARHMQGTVGLWSHGAGTRRFADISVRALGSDSVLLAGFFAGGGPDAEGWLDFALEREGVRAAARAVPPEKFMLLLAHSPDMAKAAEDMGIDLVLAGHTHGGQVRLPLVGALYSQTALGRKYAAGLFSFRKTKLYVNRGIGNALLPFRFLCRPEITVIHLLPQEVEADMTGKS
ncbi:MAG: metallophosphoesterase [Candidatus Oleimicrobiaceae bacterium]